MDYVVFSTDSLEEMFSIIYNSVGSIFSIAIFLFVSILSIISAIEILRNLAR